METKSPLFKHTGVTVLCISKFLRIDRNGFSFNSEPFCIWQKRMKEKNGKTDQIAPPNNILVQFCVPPFGALPFDAVGCVRCLFFLRLCANV